MYIKPIGNYKINISELKTYLFNNYQKLHFSTDEGKFEINGDKIYKLSEPNNNQTYTLEDKNIKSISFQLHNENFKKQIYYIPINYTYQKIDIKQYQLHKNSILTLIIENDDKFYFYTNEKEITTSLKEDLISFLSLLKLYN